MFQEEAESLLGCTADNLQARRDSDEDDFYAIFKKVLYKEYLFELMVKMEIFEVCHLLIFYFFLILNFKYQILNSSQGEQKMKTIVESVQPLKCEDYNKVLSTQLKRMTGLI